MSNHQPAELTDGIHEYRGHQIVNLGKNKWVAMWDGRAICSEESQKNAMEYCDKHMNALNNEVIESQLVT